MLTNQNEAVFVIQSSTKTERDQVHVTFSRAFHGFSHFRRHVFMPRELIGLCRHLHLAVVIDRVNVVLNIINI